MKPKLRGCIFCGKHISGVSGNKSGTCQKCWGDLRAKIAKINKWRTMRNLEPLILK